MPKKGPDIAIVFEPGKGKGRGGDAPDGDEDEYSDESGFDEYAMIATDPEVPPEERAAALKEAIVACLGEKGLV